MKWLFTMLIILCADAITPTPNVTVSEPLLGNLTNISFGDILFSDTMQEILNTYGYADVASAINNLNDTLVTLNQMDQIQNVIDQLAVVDNLCFHQMLLFVGGLNKLEEWALKMFDATAKIQSGILEGNTMHVGNYDECLKIGLLVNDSQINGQYCTSFITDTIQDKLINPSMKDDFLLVKHSYGVCVPAVCDRLSLDKIARLLEEALISPYHFYFVEDFCMSSIKTMHISTMAIVSITFFSVVGLVVLCSTFYDIYFFSRQKDDGPNLFTAFSLYSNGKKLFSTKKSADSLGCLNGMKVISIGWIVAGHRFMYALFMPLTNLVDVAKWETDPASGIISGANMGVDTFFVISGLLVVYVYLLTKEKGRNVSLGMFYLHRILRLTPALAALVLLYSSLLDYIGTGPFWPFLTDIFQGDCEKNWWSTILYIQNFVNPEAMCISQSWYLAVDTQLYFLSPLLLFPLIKWPKRTVVVAMSLIVGCSVLTFNISWQKNLAPTFFGLNDDRMKYLYGVPHVRGSTWLTGFILGYILFKIRHRAIKISKIVQMLLWLTSLAVMGGIIAYHKRIGEILDNPNRLEAAFANSLVKLAWALAVSVIIFLCVTGHGGIINRCLSHTIFTVLIRINYSVYLIHMLVIVFSLGQARTPVHGSYLDNFYYFWGDFIITSLIAVVWTLCFESPIIILEKLIFAKPKPNRGVQEFNKYNIRSVVIVEEKLESDGTTFSRPQLNGS